MPPTPPKPHPLLRSERLRLAASAPALASAVLDFQRRNVAHFARWDPPTAADFLTLVAQQQRLRRDAAAFAAGTGWRYWMSLDDERSAAGGLSPGEPARHAGRAVDRSSARPVIGQVHASQVQRGPFCSATLGYAIDAAHEGRGLMQEAIGALIDELFSARINLHRLQANVRPENARSLRLVERLGFAREGLAREYLYIDGAWRDHVLTARLNPAFVRPAGW